MRTLPSNVKNLLLIVAVVGICSASFMSLNHYNSERSGVLVGNWLSEDMESDLALEEGGRGYYSKNHHSKLPILWKYTGETLSIRCLTVDSGYGEPENMKVTFPEDNDVIALDPPYRRIKRFKRQ